MRNYISQLQTEQIETEPDSPMKKLEENLRKIKAQAQERKLEQEREKAERAEQARLAAEERKAASQELMARCRNTVETANDTMNACQKQLNEIQGTEQKFQDFSDQVDEVMAKILEPLMLNSASKVRQEPIPELQEIYGYPQQLNETEIADQIRDGKSICVLVGADVSAPTEDQTNINNEHLRGKIWNYELASRPTAFAKTVLDFWKTQHAFKQQMLEQTPNAVHHAIAQLVHFYNSTNRRGFVVTENVDGFDRASALSGEVYEIHGNLDYMRCSKECTQDLYPSDLGSVSRVIETPTCPKCGIAALPHIQNHNEEYKEEHYRANTAEEMFDSVDVLIVIGSKLQKSLPNRFAQMAQKRKKLILEINSEPVLQYGRVMVNTQPMLESFPSIVEKITAGFN